MKRGAGKVQWLLVLAVLPFLARGQEIRSIDISRPELAMLLQVKTGDVLTETAVADSIHNLFATGYFSDVQVYRKDNPDGTVDLRFETITQVLFGAVRWEGKLPVKKKRITKFLRNAYPLDEPFDTDRYEAFITALRQYLWELGFPEAKLDHTLAFSDTGDRAFPVIRIDPGEPLIIRALSCPGPDRWRKTIKLKEGDRLNREQLVHDIQRLKRKLLKKGYYGVTITHTIDVTDHGANVTVTISAGPKMDVTLDGVDPSPDLMDAVIPVLTKNGLTDTALRIARNNLYFRLLETGHVQPDVTVDRKPDRITFVVKTAKRQPVDSFVVRSPVPLDLETPSFFNVLTRTRLTEAVSETLSKDGYLKPDISFAYNPASRQLTVTVAPGPQTRIGDITWTGETGIVTALPGVDTGAVYSPERIRRAAQDLQQELARQGWYEPAVTVTRGAETDGAIPLTVSVSTGGRRVLQSILIDGNRHIRLTSIEHMLRNTVGHPVTARDIEAMRNRLESSGFFSSVRLTSMDTAPGETALFLKVTEQPLTNYRYGVGFNSDEGLRVSAGLTRNYLFHQEVSATLLTRLSSRRQQVYLNFSGRSRFMGSLFSFFEDQTDYTYSRYGGTISYNTEPGPRLNLISSLEWRRNRLTNLTVPVEEIDEKNLHPTSVISLNNQLLYDRRNDLLYPTRGYYLSFRIEPSWDLSAGRFYLKYVEKTAFYFGRLAVSQTFGHIAAPTNGYQVPVPERFFTGGTNTLRISSWYRAGPTFSTGVPQGGRVLALFNAEYRFPLTEDMEGTVFLDLGNVWSRPEDITWDSAVKDAGFGVRVRTPMGPVRVELAYNLDREAFPSRWKLVFSIGSTF